MTAFATQSSIQFSAPGLSGRAAAGAGKSKLLTASELRGLLGTGSAGLGERYYADDSTWKAIDLTGYVPYTGATGAVNLGVNALTAGAITASGTITTQNGTSPTSLFVTNTYTSGTSYGRLGIIANAGQTAYEISSDKGSTGGTNLPINIGHRDSAGTFTSALSVTTSGGVTISTSPTDVSVQSNSLSGVGFSVSHYGTSLCSLAGSLNGTAMFLWDNNGAGRTSTIGRGNVNDFNANQSVIKYVAGSQYFYASSGYSQINTTVGIDGITSSHVAFKRDGTTLKIRLGDDSADAALTVGAITSSGTITGRASTTAAATAPIKLPTGVLMTTPEAGAIEYDGTNLYFTDSGGTRRRLQVV